MRIFCTSYFISYYTPVSFQCSYTVATDGATISFDSLGVPHTLAPSTSSAATSSTSSKHTGTIVGAVIGSIFGMLFVGAVGHKFRERGNH